MQLERKLKISVIIPVHNGGHNFCQCLRSIQQSVRQPDELIVVDDGGTDNSWQVAESSGAKVIRYDSAGGPARARNRGAREADGDILFFIDADVTVHSDTIARVEETFQRYSDLDALIGSYDNEPGARNFLSQYKNLFHHYTHQTSSKKASTFWGACGAIRHSAFQTVGGFDEGYQKPCIEDIELGYRLKQTGHSIRLCKEIQVKHLKHWGPLSMLRAEIFYRALPWTELLLKQQQFNTDLNLSFGNRLSVVLVFAALVSLPAIPFFPYLNLVIPILILGLLVINWNLYQFFYTHRGLLFTLKVLPWHWLYFLYSGGAFAYGMARHYLNLWRLTSLPLPVKVYQPR